MAPGESGGPLLSGCLPASPSHQHRVEKAGEGKGGCLCARVSFHRSQSLRTSLLSSLQWVESASRGVAGVLSLGAGAPQP